MKTGELIDMLKQICVLSDVPLSITKDILNEIIKRLEELNELKKYREWKKVGY